MRKVAAAAGLSSMLVFPVAALAQHPATVGELIDKGGRRLGQQEFRTLFSGANVKGTSTINPNVTAETLYKTDGTLEGFASSGVGRGVQYWGNWSIDEQGEFCSQLQITGQGPTKSCGFLFELRGTYYASIKDEKSAPLYQREIRR